MASANSNDKFVVVRCFGENKEWYSVAPKDCKMIDLFGPNWKVEVIGSYDSLPQALAVAEFHNKKNHLIDGFVNLKLENSDKKDQLIKLPLETVDDMKAFEKELRNNEEFQRDFKGYLTKAWKIGGNVKVNRRKLLESVFCDTLAEKCSWMGNDENIPVSELMIIKFIIDFVLASSDQYSREGTINTDRVYILKTN